MKNFYLFRVRKSFIILLLISLLVSLIALYYFHSSHEEYIHSTVSLTETREQLLESFSLYMIYPYIQDSLIDYYGNPKQFWQHRIIDIRKVEIDYRNYYEITVQLQTFEGAHNPPYGKDTITFRTKEYTTSLKMIKFKHEEN